MERRTLFLLTLAAWLAGTFAAATQMAGAPKGQPEGQAKTRPGQTGSSADSIAHVTLGQAAVPLFGPWKFTVGDSPIDPSTGKPLWAEPDFDDSHWETVDLTPKEARSIRWREDQATCRDGRRVAMPIIGATLGTASRCKRRVLPVSRWPWRCRTVRCVSLRRREEATRRQHWLLCLDHRATGRSVN
jgi:hypothetical protein